MKTNLNRLHDVCMSNLNELKRKVGKTTMSCHDLAAQVELGLDHFIVVEVPSYSNHLDFLRGMITGVFIDHDLPLEWISRTEARSGKVYMKFITTSDIYIKTKGLRDYGFVRIE